MDIAQKLATALPLDVEGWTPYAGHERPIESVAAMLRSAGVDAEVDYDMDPAGEIWHGRTCVAYDGDNGRGVHVHTHTSDLRVRTLGELVTLLGITARNDASDAAA